MTHTKAPFTEPELDIDTGPQARSHTARWALGERNEHGVQRLAVLLVTYHKGPGFRAIVSNRDADNLGGFRVETFNPMAYTGILTVPATRFSATGLARAYTAALGELRRRIQSGDEATTPYFVAPT